MQPAENMSAAARHVQKQCGVQHKPLLCIVVSTGTTYDLPLLAHDPRIHAAVIGWWSAGHVVSKHLLEHARCVTAPVWFTM